MKLHEEDRTWRKMITNHIQETYRLPAKQKKRGNCWYIDIEALDRPPNNMYNSTTLLSIYTNNFTIISLCINRKEHLHLQYYYLLGEIVEISMSNNIKKRLCLTYKMLMKQHLAFHVRNKDTQKIQIINFSLKNIYISSIPSSNSQTLQKGQLFL